MEEERLISSPLEPGNEAMGGCKYYPYSDLEHNYEEGW